MLIEHKSQNDIWTPAQLLGYLDRIWSRERQPQGSKPPLTAVIPLVLFHGQSRWTAVANFQQLINPSDTLARFTPSFEYLLCDLSREYLDDLQEYASLVFTLKVLKFSRSKALSVGLPEIVGLIHRMREGSLQQRIEQADQAILDAWFDAALSAASLDSLFVDED